MAERRESTSTGEDVVFSFAMDNMERGEDGAGFINRRPTFPIGDDPRGRELDYLNAGPDNPDESYGSKNMMFRAYKGRAPLEGQEFGMPQRVGKLQKISDLRPEQFNRSVDTVALDAAKATETALLEASGFTALFPTTTITSPSPGASFSPGDVLNVEALGQHQGLQGGLQRAVMSIDGVVVDSTVLDRRDQANNQSQQWFFIYNIPPDKLLGNMEITVRSFNMANSSRAIIADDAINLPPLAEPIQGAVGTLDGRKGSATSSDTYQKLFNATGFVRTPGGDSSITVLIV